MCKNATRSLVWQHGSDINLTPLVFKSSSFDITSLDEELSLVLTVVEVTSALDYQIFTAMRQKNNSLVMDLIEEHRGINAVDEWGQTPLMLAVISQNYNVLASLLNTRMPSVNVNLAKPSGFTALFYAVEHAPVGILQALLRRGADPNVAVLQDGSRGNTPLHFACLLEKFKHAEFLIEYGANPMSANEFGQTPLQLLPSGAVTSTKLNFKRLFEVQFVALLLKI